jgi:hypothetical protein
MLTPLSESLCRTMRPTGFGRPSEVPRPNSQTSLNCMRRTDAATCRRKTNRSITNRRLDLRREQSPMRASAAVRTGASFAAMSKSALQLSRGAPRRIVARGAELPTSFRAGAEGPAAVNEMPSPRSSMRRRCVGAGRLAIWNQTFSCHFIIGDLSSLSEAGIRQAGNHGQRSCEGGREPSQGRG